MWLELFTDFGVAFGTIAAALAAILAGIISIMVAQMGLEFTAQQNERQRAFEAKFAQDEVLQSYVDAMDELLLGKNLASSTEGSVERRVARARTLTVLGTLEPYGKTVVMRFLVEARLVQGGVETDRNTDTTDPDGDTIEDFIRDLRENPPEGPIEDFFLAGPIIDLALVDLSGAEVRGGYLSVANLRAADLSGADLTGADLRLADLGLADLRGAHLPRADLRAADLFGADLSCTEPPDGIRSCTDLSDADLRGAGLTDADLSGADLSGADLSDAVVGMSNEELEQQARSLEGATMPDGSKHP